MPGSNDGRIVAVGTTVARALETAARLPEDSCAAGGPAFLRPTSSSRRASSSGSSDALLTNFHLPRSTLLMLVCAFAGRENVLAAYEEAIRQEYLFYSYGDAMFIAESVPLPIPDVIARQLGPASR